MVQLAQSYHYYLKYLMIGDSDVGKTSLLHSFIEEKYEEKHFSTIGVDFKHKIIKNKDKIVKLQIWDTAGQERFRTLTKSYYKIAHGIILIYDVTNPESFENIKCWMDQIKNNSGDNVIKILVGNKIDMKEKRKIPYAVGEQFAKENNIKFFETSSKEYINIREIFFTLTDDVMTKANKSNIDNGNYEKIILQKSSTIRNESMSSNVKSESCCM